MALRFLGGGALVLLGVAAVDAAVSSLARYQARSDGAIDGAAFSPPMRSAFLDAARALQSAVLLREPPLSGERLRAAERGLVRVLEDGVGEAKRDADIRLLLALLAARDGRFDEAMLRYEEVASDDQSDLRPVALGCVLCCPVGKADEGMSVWLPRLRGHLLGAGAGAAAADEVLDPLRPLVGELVVAAELGGAPFAIGEDDAHALTTQLVMFCAADRTDAWLAAALQDEEVPAMKKMRLWAVRAFLQAKAGVVKAKLLSAMVSAGLAVAESKEEEGDEAA